MLEYSFYNNYDLCTGGYLTSNNFDVKVNDVTLLKGSYFLNVLSRRFSSWCVFVVGKKTIEEARSYLKSAYLDFWEYRKNDLKQVVDAWAKEYDPLQNYDRYEVGGWTDELHKASKTSSEIDSTDTETPTIKTKSTNYSVGDDNAVAMETGHSITEIESGNTVIAKRAEASKNYNITEDLSDTKFDHNKHIFDNYHVYGNIGIKTNSQMALEELEKALKPVIDMFIEQFVNSYEVLAEQKGLYYGFKII